MLQAGRTAHEHIMESIELFGREVLPEFTERDEAARAAKEQRLQPIIEAALARRAATVEHRDIDGYEFPALPRQWADATDSDELREVPRSLRRRSRRRPPRPDRGDHRRTGHGLGGPRDDMTQHTDRGNLDGRRALVTGGASGIGKGTARRLVEHGANVVVGDIDEDGGRSLAVELGAAFVALDVADPAAWDARDRDERTVRHRVPQRRRVDQLGQRAGSAAGIRPRQPSR